MNNYERLEGMVAATFTPMDENGDVNLSVIDNILNHLKNIHLNIL